MSGSFTARITEIQRDHRAVGLEPSPEGDVVACRCGYYYTAEDHVEHIAKMIAQAAEEHYRPRIETPEQLDALPVGSVIGVPIGNGLMTVYELINWGEGDGPEWSTDGQPDPHFNPDDLPGLLLWSPGAGE